MDQDQRQILLDAASFLRELVHELEDAAIDESASVADMTASWRGAALALELASGERVSAPDV